MNRDEILAIADDIRTEEVYIPEWKTTLKVRGLTGTERDRYEQDNLKNFKAGSSPQINLVNARARMAVLCVVNDDGSRMFKDEDAPALGRRSAAALDRIWGVAQRLSKISDEDIEELSKNSDGNRNGSSSSS